MDERDQTYSVFELRSPSISGKVNVTGRVYNLVHKNHSTIIKLAHDPKLSPTDVSNPYITVIYKDKERDKKNGEGNNLVSISKEPSENGLQKRIFVTGYFVPHPVGNCLGILEAERLLPNVPSKENTPKILNF